MSKKCTPEQLAAIFQKRAAGLRAMPASDPASDPASASASASASDPEEYELALALEVSIIEFQHDNDLQRALELSGASSSAQSEADCRDGAAKASSTPAVGNTGPGDRFGGGFSTGGTNIRQMTAHPLDVRYQKRRTQTPGRSNLDALIRALGSGQDK